MHDPYGAFVADDPVAIDGAAGGPLAGLTFAAKDLFDIADHVTGCGNPDWRATHGPAVATAPAVAALLNAGARLVGKTHTDELAFSLNGENHHYGTPVNPAAPERIPGGSSSGSAVAVAGRLADVALGTDTGGSVRAPSSYCGIYGIRPSHGAVSLAGVMPLAPSFDTVGWFARDAATLARVGDVLLDGTGAPAPPRRLLVATDAFELTDPASRPALTRAIARLAEVLGPTTPAALDMRPLQEVWLPHFQALQWREIWLSHREWIAEARPNFGPGIAERFAAVAEVEDTAVAAAVAFRDEATERLAALLGDDTMLVLPTVPGAAPLKGLPPDRVAWFRNRALSLLCVAGLGRLPQLSLPLAKADGCPVGISLVGRHGDDKALLAAAARIQAVPATVREATDQES